MLTTEKAQQILNSYKKILIVFQEIVTKQNIEHGNFIKNIIDAIQDIQAGIKLSEIKLSALSTILKPTIEQKTFREIMINNHLPTILKIRLEQFLLDIFIPTAKITYQDAKVFITFPSKAMRDDFMKEVGITTNTSTADNELGLKGARYQDDNQHRILILLEKNADYAKFLALLGLDEKYQTPHESEIEDMRICHTLLSYTQPELHTNNNPFSLHEILKLPQPFVLVNEEKKRQEALKLLKAEKIANMLSINQWDTFFKIPPEITRIIAHEAANDQTTENVTKHTC